MPNLVKNCIPYLTSTLEKTEKRIAKSIRFSTYSLLTNFYFLTMHLQLAQVVPLTQTDH